MLQVFVKLGHVVMNANAAIREQSLEANLAHPEQFTRLA